MRGQAQQRRSPPAYLRPHTVAGPSRVRWLVRRAGLRCAVPAWALLPRLGGVVADADASCTHWVLRCKIEWQCAGCLGWDESHNATLHAGAVNWVGLVQEAMLLLDCQWTEPDRPDAENRLHLQGAEAQAATACMPCRRCPSRLDPSQRRMWGAMAARWPSALRARSCRPHSGDRSMQGNCMHGRVVHEVPSNQVLEHDTALALWRHAEGRSVAQQVDPCQLTTL